MYFQNYRLWKKWLDQFLKRPASEDPSTSNMVNGPKHCWNLTAATLSYLLIPSKKIKLEKDSLSDM